MERIAKYSLFVLALALCHGLQGVQAQQAVKKLELVTPHPFGYVIGDKIEHRVRLELLEPFHLDESSLPDAGSLTRWLELAAPTVDAERHGGTTAYTILLTYQVFHAPAGLQSLSIPEFELSLSDGGARRLTILVPEWRFWTGPLAPARLAGSDALPALRPPHPPGPIPMAPYRARMLLLSGVLAAALLYLAHYLWGIPLLDRRARPFASTLRHLRKLEHEPFTEALHREALRHVHRAFNSTAGRTLFPENLHDFFLRYPAYKGMRSQIETLFMESQGTFFDTAHREPVDMDSLKKLVDLCRKCRRIERAAA